MQLYATYETMKLYCNNATYATMQLYATICNYMTISYATICNFMQLYEKIKRMQLYATYRRTCTNINEL